MISKLCLLNVRSPSDLLVRDEIRQVIIDTELLVTSDDPAATLDRWLDAA